MRVPAAWKNELEVSSKRTDRLQCLHRLPCQRNNMIMGCVVLSIEDQLHSFGGYAPRGIEVIRAARVRPIDPVELVPPRAADDDRPYRRQR